MKKVLLKVLSKIHSVKLKLFGWISRRMTNEVFEIFNTISKAIFIATFIDYFDSAIDIYKDINIYWPHVIYQFSLVEISFDRE